jgi:hypothetical protein
VTGQGSEKKNYAIRGGVAGRERLRILSRDRGVRSARHRNLGPPIVSLNGSDEVQPGKALKFVEKNRFYPLIGF